MEKTAKKLIAIINHYPPTAPEYYLALNILKNFESIPQISIEEMAELCFTSTATLSRFCKNLGFKNYNMLRHTIEGEMHAFKKDLPIYYRSEEKNTDMNSFASIDYFITEMASSLETLRKEIHYEDIAKVIDAINGAKNITLICDSSILSSFITFQYQMLLCNKVIQYSPKWIHAADMPENSVRIMPRIVYTPGNNNGGKVMINTVERLEKQSGNLMDIHILVHEYIPYVTSERNRYFNEGKTAELILTCIMGIIQAAYSEKYIGELK
ncbi:MAG: MurR/RpiR family transcriptional regulator [Hespellia sp.]|nr:MurR/RpiR family transcriptional regulator [Hespellia sp.]